MIFQSIRTEKLFDFSVNPDRKIIWFFSQSGSKNYLIFQSIRTEKLFDISVNPDRKIIWFFSQSGPKKYLIFRVNPDRKIIWFFVQSGPKNLHFVFVSRIIYLLPACRNCAQGKQDPVFVFGGNWGVQFGVRSDRGRQAVALRGRVLTAGMSCLFCPLDQRTPVRTVASPAISSLVRPRATGQGRFTTPWAVSWRRQTSATSRYSLAPRTVYVVFVVGEVAPGEVCIRHPLYSCVRTISLILHFRLRVVRWVDSGPLLDHSSAKIQSQPILVVLHNFEIAKCEKSGGIVRKMETVIKRE